MYISTRFILLVLWAFFMVSCDTEHSCENTFAKLTIANIELDTDILPYESSSNSLRAGETLQPDRRFIVAVYAQNGLFLDKKTITESDINQTSYPINISFDLPNGSYRLVFWSDYVVHGSTEDLYYGTEDLKEITLMEDLGNTELKDAYTAYKDIDLDEETNQITECITLQRPFAKYQIIANDFDEYIKKGEIGVEGITTKITYTGSNYNSYNAVEGQPGNMGSGMSYTGTAKVLSTNQLLLSWDYIWAKGEKLKLKLNMKIYDNAGRVVNTVNNLEIPYTRNKFTTVTGAFLTDEQDSGIGIITEYDGDINIPLP